MICIIYEGEETFYGHHTAQHPTAVTTHNIEKFRSFKSKENIHKKEVGPYRGFGYLNLISDPKDPAKGTSEKYCKFAIFVTAATLGPDSRVNAYAHLRIFLPPPPFLLEACHQLLFECNAAIQRSKLFYV